MKDMSKPNNEQEVENLLNKMDNYRQTVGAIVALGYTLIQYYEADFRIGHPLTPSSQNRIQNTDDVTPDIVSQGKDLDLIGEVKKSFPKDKNGWLDSIKQIEKYDDEFTKWIKKDVKTHDVMLLTHYSHSGSVKNFIEEKIKSGEVQFNRPLSIVEFVRNSERNTYWGLKKIWGKITNQILDRYISDDPILVNADDIVRELSSVWFYDATPEVPYTMSILWNEIFPQKATPERFRAAGGRGTIEMTITIDEILQSCKTFFSSQDSSFPQKSWIITAMDDLAKLGRAKKISGETYTVYYHRIAGDPLQTLTREWLSKSGDIRDYLKPKEDKKSSS